MKSQMRLKMGHVGSKAWSRGQILEKPCVCSSGRIFHPMLMKLGQNVLLNPLPDQKILDWSKLKQIEDDILECYKNEK